jgi:hypothetical protein
MTYTELLQNTNMTGLDNIALSANATTGNTFWSGMYWMVLIIILILTSTFGIEIALLLTFFIGLVAGIFMLYLSWINITTFGITEGVLLFAVIYILWSSNKNR